MLASLIRQVCCQLRCVELRLVITAVQRHASLQACQLQDSVYVHRALAASRIALATALCL